MNRLFIGQGSLHILTAIVAGETCTRGGAIPSAGDVLLFHGLNPERDQSERWARVLERAARRLGTWRRVIYLDPDRIAEWTRSARENGWRGVAPAVRAEIGADTIDEIYIQKNDDFINRLLVASFPAARSICYGDGLGLNYSARYWLPEEREPPRPAEGPRGLRRWRSLGRRLGARLLRGPPPESEPPLPRFDRHCLLLPNCFDDHVEDPAVASPEGLRRKIDALVPILAEEAEGRSAALDLAAALSGASEIVVLLPSCFSEAGRIDPGAEVAAYRAVVDGIEPLPGAAIVVKPHPRDLQAKTDRLLATLSERYARVHVLDDPRSRYLPFEVTLRLALSSPSLPPRRFVTFSSACLALELLFGERTVLGFGEASVRRSFRPEFVERRLVHERDLRLAIERVRAERITGPRPPK